MFTGCQHTSNRHFPSATPARSHMTMEESEISSLYKGTPWPEAMLRKSTDTLQRHPWPSHRRAQPTRRVSRMGACKYGASQRSTYKEAQDYHPPLRPRLRALHGPLLPLLRTYPPRPHRQGAHPGPSRIASSSTTTTQHVYTIYVMIGGTQSSTTALAVWAETYTSSSAQTKTRLLHGATSAHAQKCGV